MPAGTRPIWKGQLRLSLVAIPVDLFTASKANARPRFRQIHESTSTPINYDKVAGKGNVIDLMPLKKSLAGDTAPAKKPARKKAS